MNEEQRRAILPELDRLTAQAETIRSELDALIARYKAYEYDPMLATPAHTARNLCNALHSSAETLRRESARAVQDYVTSWYKSLHWDMSDPIVEIDEKDLTDPTFESCSYDGQDSFDDWYKWTVIMTTKTHEREKVVVLGDGVDFQVYSSEKI